MKCMLKREGHRCAVLRPLIIGLGCFCLATAAASQTMKDPTRPPAPFLEPGDAAVTVPAQESGLLSIKRAGKRRTALLHGDWVKPGDKVGEAVVVRIDDQSVVLRYPDARLETLRMYPEVDMKSVKAAKRTAGQ